jgi:hypothetical protein
MQRSLRPKFFGYVKVELVSRSPRKWGWSIHSDGAEICAAAMSDTAFGSAEDAWREGRRTLAMLEAGKPVNAAGALDNRAA